MKPEVKQLLEEAWAMRREARYDRAGILVEKALRLCDEEDYNSLGRIYHIYMQFESDHGNPEKALELCQMSLAYYKKAGNLNRNAHSTRHIANLEYHLGKEGDAEQHYRNAIAMYRENPNTFLGDLANALRGFGILLEKRGKIEEAIETWEETKKLYQACRLQEGVDEADQRLNSLQ